MNKISIQFYKSLVGELILGAYNGKLCLADWRYRKMRAEIDARIQKGLNAEYIEESTPVIQQTIEQLMEYLEGKRKIFDIPLELVGTDFQKSVWQELLKIPFGETATYLGLSQKLGNEKAIRAVAAANGANAISILVPCHRIIGTSGKLIGYAGGLPAKKKLLELEGIGQDNLQMSLFD
jgi:methylated-DNA-[protein]-cysteine S-methyltransferase